MNDYADYLPLKNYVLEESWVLGVWCTPRKVTFDLEVVLAKSHPDLRPAPANEAFDCRRASLSFWGVTAVNWTAQRHGPATDASGEIDYGHIDNLSIKDNVFALSGDWGRMEITADSAEITLTGS